MFYNGWWVNYNAATGQTYQGGSTGGSYFGQAIAGSSLATFETNHGKKGSVVHFGRQWLQSNAFRTYNVDIKGAIDNNTADGRVVMIDWGNWQISGGHAPDVNLNYAAILAGTNTFGGVSIDTFLHTWFASAAVHGTPFFLRMWHEMNAANGWGDADFPWCIGNVTSGGNAWTNSPQQHIDAWNKIYGIAQSEGATNATFVWCPNVLSNTGRTSTYTLAQLYPGSSAVHWLGLDGYEQATTSRDTMQQVFRGGGIQNVQDSWGLVHALDQNKPIMICETGAHLIKNGVADHAGRAAWYKDALEVYLPDPAIFPSFGGINWFMNQYSDDEWVPDKDATIILADSLQFKASIGQPSWLAGNQFNLPANGRPIELYSIQRESDPWATVIGSTSGITARWPLNEVNGSTSVADSGPNGHTSNSVGSGVTLGSTGALPTRPAQTGAGFNGVAANSKIDFLASTDYSPAALGTMSVISMLTIPTIATQNGWIVSLGNTGQFEWGLRIDTSGNCEFIANILAGGSIANMTSGSAVTANGQPIFVGASLDTLTPTGFIFTNGAIGNYAVLAGGAFTHGTAHLNIGGRADNNLPLLAGSVVGETLMVSPMINKFAMAEFYAAWKAAIASSRFILFL